MVWLGRGPKFLRTRPTTRPIKTVLEFILSCNGTFNVVYSDIVTVGLRLPCLDYAKPVYPNMQWVAACPDPLHPTSNLTRGNLYNVARVAS